MEVIWKYLINASIYGTITGIVILMARFVLKNKISKRCMCLLWMIFIFKLVMPYGVESNFSLFNIFSTVDQNIYINSVVSENILNNSVYQEGGEKNLESDNFVGNDDEERNLQNQSKEVISQNLNSVNLEQRINNNKFTIIKVAWIVGFIVMVCIYCISYLKFKNNIKIVDSDEFHEIYKTFEYTKTKINIKRDIKLVIGENISSPCIVGNFNPKVLIPVNLVDLKENQLEYIFLHELTHYKRGDLFLNYILIILQSIHWFNPIVWALFKQIRNDIELACDEKVLLTLDEKEHNKYGLAILDVIQRTNLSKKSLGVMNMADDKKTVKNRIKAIKNNKLLKGKRKFVVFTGVICVLLLGGFLLTNASEIPYSKVLLENKDDSKDKESLYDSVSYINIKNLGYNGYDGIEISENLPYKVSVSYKLTNYNTENIKNNLYKNAAIVFSLIKNVDEITYKLNSSENTEEINFKKTQIEKELGVKFDELNEKNYNDFILKLSNKIKGYTTLDDAIASYFSSNADDYYEFEAEAHVKLGQNQKGNEFEVYLLSYGAYFQFINGMFCETGGWSSVPVRITICKNDRGEYCFINAIEAEEGALFAESVKNMFPKKETIQAIYSQGGNYNKKVYREINQKAEDYLKSINREADVVNYLQTEDITLTDKQYEQLSDMNIGDFLDFGFIGTYEEVKNGKRYIYETKNEGDVFNFNKYDEARNLLATSKVKIDNDNVELLENHDKNYDLSNNISVIFSLIDNYDGTYDVRIRVGNIHKNENIAVAYALNGDKYEIVNNSSDMTGKVKLIDEITNETLKTFYYSGGNMNGEYFMTTNDLKKYIDRDKYALELQFKINPKEEPIGGDKIVFEVFSYDNIIDSISIGNQNINIKGDIQKKKSKTFDLNDFFIEINE